MFRRSPPPWRVREAASGMKSNANVVPGQSHRTAAVGARDVLGMVACVAVFVVVTWPLGHPLLRDPVLVGTLWLTLQTFHAIDEQPIAVRSARAVMLGTAMGTLTSCVIWLVLAWA